MVGACGMGMGPLAIYLRQRGVDVLAWDDKPRERVAYLLRQAGVCFLDAPELPEGVSRVVYSSAVWPEHPLRAQARERGIPQIRRGEMLAEEAAQRRLVAVAGSHGKTTTTGMLIRALARMHFDCGYVLGGLFADTSAPAAGGSNEWLVAEVDESDGTIEHFTPQITVVPNLDWDHADHYRRSGEIEAAFGRLFRRTRGHVFISAADPVLNRLAEENPGPAYVRFGPGGDYAGDLVGQDGNRQRVRLGGLFGEHVVDVRAIGAFNAQNAVAALAVAKDLVPDFNPGALADFPGIRRRQTLLLERKGLAVYMDYAHHPSEIDPLLAALRQAHPDRQLVAVFQPHRYTRTAQFKAAFARSLERADRVLLMDVYPASERPIPGGYSSDLLEQFQPGFPVAPVATRSDLVAALVDLPNPAVVAFVGAGDIEDWADDYVTQLKKLKGKKGHPVFTPSTHERLRARVSAATPVIEEEPLGRRTTLGVGGPARYYAEPATLADLQGLLAGAKEAGVDVLVLGRGSNLLVADAGFPGLVIRLSSEAFTGIEHLGGGRLKVGAGARLKQVCAEAARLGLEGFEFAEGIPASVGGALRMNAGAMGGWIFDLVETVEYVTLDGELHEEHNEHFRATYRHTPGLENAIAVGAVLRAREGATPEVVRAAMDRFAAKRKESQPREPSAGCMFKNPDGDYAGRLVDISGLKGLRVGGAEVSEVHGNFVINRGGASCEDVLELIRRVRATVKERHGVELQPEVQLVGAKWEDVL